MTEKFAILFGGRSTEHDASIHSFEACWAEVQASPGHARRFVGALFVDRAGGLYWWSAAELASRPTNYSSTRRTSWPEFLTLARPGDAFLFNLLHGNEGEDGAWQGLAEVVGLRGSFGRVFASCFTMSKWAQAYAIAGLSQGLVRAPETWVLDRHSTRAEVERLCREIGATLVLKPNSLGASLFTGRFEAHDTAEIWTALQDALRYDREVLLQRFVVGTEYTCGCVQERGRVVALPLIRVHTADHFLGHAEKHQRNKVRVEMPGDDDSLVRRIQALSVGLFRRIGMSNMARFDFIHQPGGDALYYLECNSIPGLGQGSAFPMMLAKSGRTRLDLLDRCVENSASAPTPLKEYRYVIEH